MPLVCIVAKEIYKVVRKTLALRGGVSATLNSEHGTRNTEFGTRNTEFGTRETLALRGSALSRKLSRAVGASDVHKDAPCVTMSHLTVQAVVIIIKASFFHSSLFTFHFLIFPHLNSQLSNIA